MMTIAQASKVVGRGMGLPDSFDGSTAAINALPMETKLSLTANLGAYIKNNPSQFTSQQVGVAKTMPASFPQYDTSASAAAGEFLDAFLVSAKTTLSGVGSSLTTLAFFAVAIYIVVQFLPGSLAAAKKAAASAAPG